MANVKFEFASGFQAEQVEVSIGDYVRAFKRADAPFEEPEIIARALLRDYCAMFIEVGAPAPASSVPTETEEPKRKR